MEHLEVIATSNGSGKPEPITVATVVFSIIILQANKQFLSLKKGLSLFSAYFCHRVAHTNLKVNATG